MNAANIYRDAFALLPEGGLDASPQLLSGDSPEADSLVERGKAALDALRRAAACPGCDWGPADGPALPIADFSGARHLAVLALMRANRSLHGGDVGAGLDDLVAVMALGRHLGRGLYLGGLAGFPIEDLAVTRALELLGGLDREARQGLVARLDALPPFPDLVAAVRAEEVYFRANYRDWLAALDEADIEQPVRAQFGLPDEARELRGLFLSAGDPAEEMLQTSGGNKARLVALADEALGAFDTLASVAGGDSADRVASLREAAADNPLLADVLRSFDRVRPVWDRFRARVDRLRAQAAAGEPGAGEGGHPPFSAN
jgi:hypothetical protein